MMFLAGMQAIPSEQYEAAALDGANVFRRFLDITLPSLRPAITITALLSTIWTANSINFIYALTRGGPVDATMTFPMLAFEIGIAGARQLGLGGRRLRALLPALHRRHLHADEADALDGREGVTG